MALICPNLSDNDVAADFYAIVDRTNDNIAYNLWNRYQGDVDAINAFISAKTAIHLKEEGINIKEILTKYNIPEDGMSNIYLLGLHEYRDNVKKSKKNISKSNAHNNFSKQNTEIYYAELKKLRELKEYVLKKYPTINKENINKILDEIKISETSSKQPQENPIIKLAKRWNINDKGFTESNSLPKSSVEDMKKEAKELGLGIEEASSGSYYFTKGNKLIVPYRDAFQLEKEPGENPIQELQDKMTRWAERNGIEVLALEDLMKRIGANEAYDDKVVGVANILNKLIGLAENKIDITTLPEEVAHFMVEFMLNDVSVQRALDLVTKTDTYTKVKEDYKDIYKEEIDFKKEALGKILAEEVIRQYKNTANSPVKAFINAIKTKFLKAWKNLLNKDAGRVRDELSQIVNPMAKSLLNEEVIKDTRTVEQVETTVEMLQVNQSKLKEEKQILISNPKGIKKIETEEDRYYKDNAGNRYLGLSNIVNPSDFVDKKGAWKGAVKIGTAVDVVLRGFFMNKTPKYEGEIAKRLSKKAYTELLQTAKQFKDSLRDENGKLDHIEFLTEGLFIADNSIKATKEHVSEAIKSAAGREESYGIATELDMVIINKKTGEKIIVDFKTVRVDPSKGQSVKEKLEASYYGKKSKAEGYSKQQNASRILIAKNENIDFSGMRLLTVEVNYNEFEETTDKAEVKESLFELEKESVSEVFPKEYARQINPKTLKSSKKNTEKTEDKRKQKQFLEKAITRLEGIQQLRRNVSDLGAKSEKFRAIQAKIDGLKADVVKAQYSEGLIRFIDEADIELGNILDFLNMKNEQSVENYSVDDKQLINLAAIAGEAYENLIKDLQQTMKSAGLNIPEAAADIARKAQATLGSLSKINLLSIQLQNEIASYVLSQGNRDHNGNIVDEGMEDGDILTEGVKDYVDAFRLKWGAAKNSQSNIVKVAVKLMNNTANIVRRFATKKARTLLNLQAQIKNFDSKTFYETNAKGENTGYLISEYNQGEYYAAMNTLRTELAEKLGVEDFNSIIKENLNKTELAIYTDMWKKFFEEHSQKKKVTITRNGEEVTVNKAFPAEIYKNAAFTKMKSSPEVYAFYEELLKTKVEALNKLPRYLRTEKNKYLMPQVRKTFAERIAFKDITRNLGQVIKEIGVVEEDETMFGQTGSLGSKIIPIHFNRPLDNMKDLSEDITSIYTRYSEMAENFKQMNVISGDMEAVRAALAEREYKLRGKPVKGRDVREYKLLVQEIEKLVLGVTKEAARIKIGNKEFNVTKLAENMAGYFRITNLAFNLSTSTAGFAKGSIDKLLEDQIGLYTTNTSSTWAATEFLKNLPQVLLTGSSKQTNKMHLLLEQAGNVALDKIIKDTNMSRAGRVLLNSEVFYSNYMMADYGMKGRTTLAIYDNIRLYKGQFINHKRFLEIKGKEKGLDKSNIKVGAKIRRDLKKETKEEWSSLRDKSLYNALEVKDGVLEVKDEFKTFVTDKVLNTADNTANHVNHILDGTLSPEDKSNAARKWWGSFLLMHRGWVLSGLDNRFKKGGMNFETGEWEEGYYKSFANFMRNKIWEEGVGIRIALLSNKTTPGEMRGVKKAMLDFMYMNIVAVIAAFGNIAAEDGDEDDYTLQLAAYQLNRILLETRSFFSIREFVEMLEEPVVAARAIKDISDITNAISFGDNDIITRGQYKDWTKGGKWWMKRTPFKNIYELQFPKSKNDYIKNIIGSATYDLLRTEDGEEKDWWEYSPTGKTSGFFDGILQRDNND